MSSPLLVSVITPTFNRITLFRKLVKDMYAQTLRTWQWVVVNNYSEAYGKDLIHALLDPFRPVVPPQFVSDPPEENIFRIMCDGHDILLLSDWSTHSAAYARNVGLGRATGDLVYFFDDDDVMYPTCLEHLSKPFESPQVQMSRGLLRMSPKFNGNLDRSFATPEIMLRRAIATPTWKPEGQLQDQQYFLGICETHGLLTTPGAFVDVEHIVCEARDAEFGGIREGGF
jgi:cellulose synthase/poly-beta-1,6-N-acetylglucosamine synthase-like glycosyltransferase